MLCSHRCTSTTVLSNTSRICLRIFFDIVVIGGSLPDKQCFEHLAERRKLYRHSLVNELEVFVESLFCEQFLILIEVRISNVYYVSFVLYIKADLVRLLAEKLALDLDLLVAVLLTFCSIDHLSKFLSDS